MLTCEGADPNLENKILETPLHLAAMAASESLLDLFEYGGNLFAESSGWQDSTKATTTPYRNPINILIYH